MTHPISTIHKLTISLLFKNNRIHKQISGCPPPTSIWTSLRCIVPKDTAQGFTNWGTGGSHHLECPGINETNNLEN